MTNTSATENDRVPLGPTGLQISPIGLGAWSWGDKFFWDYGKGYGEGEIKSAFLTTLASGINFIDTAEIYGQGQSERFLGGFLADDAMDTHGLVIATKFMPLPWKVGKGRLRRALEASLKRLGLPCVDLYQMHAAIPPVPIEVWMEGMADAVEAGLTKAVGVSNYDVAQTRRAYAALARRNVPLASNQVEYSLLQRKPEHSGLLSLLNDLGATLIAYSPLAMGVLTGKYTPENPPPGFRGRRYNRNYLSRIQPLTALLREIGEAHGKTPSQAALNWVICKGAVPIPGAKNARQAQENAGAFGWRLTDGEVAALDAMSERTTKDK